jgi:hypothetical protein
MITKDYYSKEYYNEYFHSLRYVVLIGVKAVNAVKASGDVYTPLFG